MHTKQQGTAKRALPCRVSFLSCAEIPQLVQPWASAPRTQRKQKDSSKTGSSGHRQHKPLHTKRASDDGSGDESHEQAMLRIWAPTLPAKPDKYTRREKAYMQARAINGSDDSYIDADSLLSVWVCPEVKKRIQQRKIQRERALLLAQRIIGPRNTEKTDTARQSIKAEAKGRDSDDSSLLQSRKKRRVSDSPEPSTPPPSKPEFEIHSPELLKPQSLLIPELLPKGMFREPKAQAAAKAPSTGMACSDATQTLMHSEYLSMSNSSPGDQVGLGLDLGFDIGQKEPKGQPQESDANAITSSIHEITRFLERDIDVFTPLTKAQTVKKGNPSSSFSSPLPPPPPPIDFASLLMAPAGNTCAQNPRQTHSAQKKTDQAQDLISDILNMRF